MGVGSVGSATQAGTLARMLADAGGVRRQLDTVSAQVSSGHVGATFGALGTAARTPLLLRPQQAHLEAWQKNIDGTTGRMGVAQAALTRLGAIASSFHDKAAGLNSDTIDSVAAQARAALKEVAGLLDSKYGDTYVFAGADSANPPVPNPDGILTSGLVTQIGSLVAGLSINGSAAVAFDTAQAAKSDAPGTTPFSATLPATAGTIEIGEGQYAPNGLLANRNTLTAAPADSPTGSWSRDLLRGLATLASLGRSQANDPGFTSLVQDTFKGLGAVVTGLATEQGVLGSVQSRLTEERTRMDDTSLALKKQIGNAEDVDMAEAISRQAAIQVRLQASYQMIAAQKDLSLTRFL